MKKNQRILHIHIAEQQNLTPYEQQRRNNEQKRLYNAMNSFLFAIINRCKQVELEQMRQRQHEIPNVIKSRNIADFQRALDVLAEDVKEMDFQTKRQQRFFAPSRRAIYTTPLGW